MPGAASKSNVTVWPNQYDGARFGFVNCVRGTIPIKKDFCKVSLRPPNHHQSINQPIELLADFNAQSIGFGCNIRVRIGKTQKMMRGFTEQIK